VVVSDSKHVSIQSDKLTHLTKMASPFLAVLRSNYAASVIEAPQIEQIVSKHDKDIAEINEEIAQTLVTLNRLRYHRAGLVAFRQAHKALVSPIRRTPPELLAKIFELCLPGDEFVGVDAMDAPLLLVQICSHWRKITLSTRSLWNSISVKNQIQ
jgi:F-box-like